MGSGPVLGLSMPAPGACGALTGSSFPCSFREALLAEMGVAMREDGGTLGVFSPKKVGSSYYLLPGEGGLVCIHTGPLHPALLLLASLIYFTSLFLALKPMGEIPVLTPAGYEHQLKHMATSLTPIAWMLSPFRGGFAD